MSNSNARVCLRASLLIACGLAHTACGLARAADAPDPDPARFESEIAAFENWDRQNSAPANAVLFVGSSSIRLWHTAERFPDAPVINRGFGGSHVSDVNHFTSRVVLKYKPRAIVFYAGDNDIADGKTPQRVYDDFLEFVQLVRERLPKTRIYFISIKPSIARLKLWPKMKEANTFVWRLAGINTQVVFVDIASPMLNGREVPSKDLFLDDGLHLNAAGYDLWTKTLRPALEELSPPR